MTHDENDSTSKIDLLVDALQAVPQKKLVISFLFFRGTREESDVSTTVRYSALVPLLEAIGAQLKILRERAFDPKTNEIRNPNAVLDIHGLFLFLGDYINSAVAQGHLITRDAQVTFWEAYEQLKPLVKEAIDTWD